MKHRRAIRQRRGLGWTAILVILLLPMPAWAWAPPEGSQDSGLTLTLESPPFEIVRQQGLDTIQVGAGQPGDGYSLAGSPGEALLPRRVYNVAVPPNADLGSLRIEVVEAQVIDLPGVYRLATAVPDMTSADGREALGYGTDGQPAGASWVRLLPAGQMRKWRFARVEFSPLRYDPASGALSAAQKLTLRLSYDLSSQTPAGSALLGDRVLDDVAQQILVNYDAAQGWYSLNADTAPTQDVGHPRTLDQPAVVYDYVIVTTNAIEAGSSYLDDFIAHKQSRGYSVLTVTEDEYGSLSGQSPNGTAEKIRKWLQDHYVEYSIRYVLLIGNPDPDDPSSGSDSVGDVPMKMCWPRQGYGSYEESPTDAFYADLTGNWNLDGDTYFGEWADYAAAGGVDFGYEVIVGRIPVYGGDTAALDAILAKTVDYESEANSSWRKNALLPMSFSTSTYDGAPLAEQMMDDYLDGAGFSSWTQYQQGSGACALDSAYESDQELRGGTVVRDRWAANDYGLVLWWGHGSSTGAAVGCDYCWDGTLFGSSYTSSLDDDHPAFVYQNSCLNGYPEVTGNLQYALLKQGAVTTVGATRVSWFNTGVGYGSFDGSTTNSGIGYEYASRLMQEQSAGEALHNTKASMAPGSTTRLMNFYDFGLYGDPSVRLVIASPDAPSELAATPVSQTRIALSWTDNSDNESGFTVERSPDGSSGWAQIADRPAGSTTYSDTLLACGTTAYYRVRAYNAGGASGYSNVAHATTIPCAPDAPTDLAAVPLSQSRIALSWTDNSDNESGFTVERSPNGSSGWAQIADLITDTQAYTDTGLACELTYYYRVHAYNAGGIADSEVMSATTLICAPDAPTDLAAAPLSQSRIALSWMDNSDDESGFTVERSLSGVTGWAQIADLIADTQAYTDGELSCGTTYHYRVRAYNAGGSSAYSSTAYTTTVVCTPTAPSNLAAAPLSQSRIALSWTDNSDDESGFTVERSPNGSSGWAQIADLALGSQAYTDTELSCGTTYHYRVRAYNVGGLSDYTNVAYTTTVVCTPTAPADLAAAPLSQSRIALSWTDNSDNESGFHVERSPNGSTAWAQIADLIADTHAYTDGELSCGTTYHYRVRAYNVGGMSDYTNVVYTATLGCPPTAPTDLAATPLSQSRIALSWTDNSDDESGFHVERSLSGVTGWAQIADLIADSRAYTDSELSCGTTYHYRVRAYNANGPSAYSSTAYTTTVVCTPTAPTGLVATPRSTSRIDLSWTDSSDDESGFHVERSPDGIAGWTQIAAVAADVTAYADHGLLQGTSYHYRVRAHNVGGLSDYTNVASAETLRPFAFVPLVLRP
jgi:hypothetical protein